jgi:hypothetical protein
MSWPKELIGYYLKKKYNFSSERSPGRNEEVKHDVTGAV